MDSVKISWADGIPDTIRTRVLDFFSSADTKGEEAAKRFSEFFHEKGQMHGMGAPIHSREDIYRSRLGAWDEVEFRKHILYQVYSMGPRGVDLLVLGKLESTLKNGRSFEMEFAAQVIFADATSDRPEAISYKVWADKRVAIEAAKGE